MMLEDRDVVCFRVSRGLCGNDFVCVCEAFQVYIRHWEIKNFARWISYQFHHCIQSL